MPEVVIPAPAATVVLVRDGAGGFSLTGNGPNIAMIFTLLKPWNERIGSANTASTCFVLVSGSDTAQGRANFLVAEALFAGMVQGPMVRKYQMGAGTYLDAFGSDLDALSHQTIGLLEKGLGINHHAVAQHASLTLVNNA